MASSSTNSTKRLSSSTTEWHQATGRFRWYGKILKGPTNTTRCRPSIFIGVLALNGFVKNVPRDLNVPPRELANLAPRSNPAGQRRSQRQEGPLTADPLSSTPAGLSSQRPGQRYDNTAVLLAFQLLDFGRTGHEWARRFLSAQVLQLVREITTSTLRPTTLTRSTTPIGRTRSSSAEPSTTWPQEWATDRSALREDVNRFLTSYNTGSTGGLPPLPESPPEPRPQTPPLPSIESLTPNPDSSGQNPPGRRSALTPPARQRPPLPRFESAGPTITPISNAQHPPIAGMASDIPGLRQIMAEEIPAALRNLQDPQHPRGGATAGPGGPDGQPLTANTFVSVGGPAVRPRDIGFFDLDKSKAAVEVEDNHSIYHNVFSFTNRLRVKVLSIDPVVLHQTIDSCLWGKPAGELTKYSSTN
ncbi:MAG: hypothetical protein M1823_001582 [Watsoniomyces obsoletus]|nr:MAG: hypothetical protein M1823_001582 [Watsoniomyces obsoletus]